MSGTKQRRAKRASESRHHSKPSAVELPDGFADAINDQRTALYTAINELYAALLMMRRSRAGESEVNDDMEEVTKSTTPIWLVEPALVKINKVKLAPDHIAMGLMPKAERKGVSA